LGTEWQEEPLGLVVLLSLLVQLAHSVDEIHGKMAMYFFILLPFYKV